jgi:hypothetical protein
MSRRCTGLLIASLLLTSGGCGTILNMRDGPDPKMGFANAVPSQSIYGGVRMDSLAFCGGLWDCTTRPHALDEYLGGIPWLMLFLADVPLCAVADTLTLPITIRTTLRGENWPACPPSTEDNYKPKQEDLGPLSEPSRTPTYPFPNSP